MTADVVAAGAELPAGLSGRERLRGRGLEYFNGTAGR